MNHMAGESSITLVECPRDAMQGWKSFIPTDKKVAYLNTLLQCGFDTLDFGSFVSAAAIPQMADTKEVLAGLSMEGSKTKLLAIIANTRGARDAASHDAISYLGFPFSVSETFQLRNTNSTREESLKRVIEIQDICLHHGKQLVVYLSMGFGNPYGDPWSADLVYQWAEKIVGLGISIISLADTVGLATAEQVSSMTAELVHRLPGQTIGVHLHSTPFNRQAKIDAALSAGCKRFDGALKGIGGCPMAGDELVGNMNSEWMISYFESLGLQTGINMTALQESLQMAAEIFA